MRRALPKLLALFFILAPAFNSFPQSTTTAAQPYLTAEDLDLTLFLAPPPAQDSAQTRAEIDEILRLQAARTPAMVAAVQADQDLSAFRFADVLGARFTARDLPVAAAFFTRLVVTAGAVVDPAKSAWNRPRPYATDARVNPCAAKPNVASYPSGHANAGYVLAIVLAQIVPEKRVELFERARQFAEHRVVGGVHFRSDIEAGRLSGTLIAAALFGQTAFRRDLVAAKGEVRSVLGYQGR
jgi:acid phosphatase (class A)